MNKISSLFLLALGIFSTSCVPAPVPTQEFPELPDFEGRTVTVGVINNNLPFAEIDAEGAARGFDVDLLNAVAEKLNLQLVFTVLNPETALEDLNNGTLDVLSGEIYFSIARSEQVDFTVPNVLARQRLLVPNADPAATIVEFKDRTADRVAVIADTIEQEASEAYFGPDRVETFATREAAAEAVLAATVSALVLKATDATAIQQTNPGSFRILPGFVAGTMQSFVLKKDADLSDGISQAVTELVVDGTTASLREKWGF